MYFEKPDTWGDELYAYVYDPEINENASWPGVKMTKESDGKYSYTFDKDWNSPLIIFNDGDTLKSVQYPQDNGLKVEPGKTYAVQ